MDDDHEESMDPLDVTCSIDEDCSRVIGAHCSFGSAADSTTVSSTGTCFCPSDIPILNRGLLRCLAKASLNETCIADQQCSAKEKQSFCFIPNGQQEGHCQCYRGYHVLFQGKKSWCIRDLDNSNNLSVDPAMIGILCALVLMFIIICIVLRMFSKQRFREQRTIFNTPNPRLMNLSLLSNQKSNSKHGRDGESKHGSSMSLHHHSSKTPNGSNKDVEAETPLTNVCTKPDHPDPNQLEDA